MRGLMNTNLKALASLVLASAVVAGYAQTSTGGAAPAKKKTTTTRRAAKPSVQSQIEELRNDLNSQRSQIDSLKQQLADRDAQLQQAQQTAASAQAAAQQAQQAAQAQQTAITENQQSVSNLQGAVGDLKTNTQSLVTTIQDNQTQVKKAIENPDVIHFKNITISPTGSFIEFATVNRTHALGADINTPFTADPFTAADASHISEFYASGRQSRVALLAQGKVNNATLRGYYEADWLGTGVTSNNNQSNSYVLRQRQIWAQAQLNSGWVFTGGQMWSLATPYQKGLINRSEWIPLTIDAAYTTGFTWERQPGFRVVKIFNPQWSLGLSAEQAQTLAPVCNSAGTGASCPVNYLLGAQGANGGLYNGAGQPGATSSAPVTTYSFNYAPDLIAKVALDKGNGHYELWGVSRFFRDRVYPNMTIVTNPTTGVKTVGGSSAGAYNDETVGGGVGGSAHYLAYQKKINIGLEGLYGDGIGRYGDGQIADLTLRPSGQLAPLHGFSALGSVEANVTPRLQVYAYYGGDYVGRRIYLEGSGQAGYGIYNAATSGCNTEPLPGTTSTTTPTGAANGFSPGSPSNCAVNNKDVQEVTVGYWYDFYRGEFGRLRQGFQYSWLERNTWSGAGGIAPNPVDNMFFTSFRYYLP
jgi:type II secretory pathway pseudopilin PulG